MQKKLYIYLLLSVIFLLNASAQIQSTPKNSIHQAMTFHLLDVESGLSNNYINSIEEDDIGRIWIATSDGLNRYDGSVFEHYKTNDDNGLKNNNISQIKFDKKSHNLLLATDGGMNVYDPNLEVFEPLGYKLDSLYQVVNCFTKDTKGRLILSLLRSKDGLYIENSSEELMPYWDFMVNTRCFLPAKFQVWPIKMILFFG